VLFRSSVEQAALVVRDEAVSAMAELIAGTLAEAGLKAAQVGMFCFGGNGPMFGALVAERLGIAQAYAFDFGPVFGAFGSSVSDVAHVYERGVGLDWTPANLPAIADGAARLYLQAVRDLEGEGFDPAAATYRYEIELGAEDRFAGSCRFEYSGTPAAEFLDAAARALAAAGLEASGEPLQLLRLTARLGIGAKRLQKPAGRRESVRPSTRPMQFSGRGPEPLPAHVWEQLNVGDRIAGPAMINGATLTCPVPPKWVLTVDDYGNAALRRPA
jgi:N-methylhydantoinase A/oxoprolinase/acetone carboxylase beta subunit